MEERCVYSMSQEKQAWSLAKREAWISSGVFGFSRAIQVQSFTVFERISRLTHSASQSVGDSTHRELLIAAAFTHWRNPSRDTHSQHTGWKYTVYSYWWKYYTIAGALVLPHLSGQNHCIAIAVPLQTKIVGQVYNGDGKGKHVTHQANTSAKSLLSY